MAAGWFDILRRSLGWLSAGAEEPVNGDEIDGTEGFSVLPEIYERGSGWNTHWFNELFGANAVAIYTYAPNPATFRGEYYYNSMTNMLYKKIKLDWRPLEGIKIAKWKAIGNR